MKSHVLTVIANPKTESASSSLLASTVRAAEAAEATIESHDLYRSGFDPVLRDEDLPSVLGGGPAAGRIAEEQARIRAADLIVLHYPVYWYQPPAMVKGWVDRCFGVGFGFSYQDGHTQGLLTGKRVLMVQTAGAPRVAYDQGDPGKFFDPDRSPMRASFRFCGMAADVLTHYGVAPEITAQDWESIQSTTVQAVQNALSESAWPPRAEP